MVTIQFSQLQKRSIAAFILLTLLGIYLLLPGKSSAIVGGGPQDIALTVIPATNREFPSFPPDTMGSVGPTQFLLAINGRIRTFDKFQGILDNALDQALSNFFQPSQEGSRTFITDPQVRYDRLSGHWFVSALGDCSRLLIAVSGGPTVTATDWKFHYFFPSSGTFTCAAPPTYFVDQSWLGVDSKAVYLSGFDIPSGNFDAFVIDKSNLINNTNLIQNIFRFPSIGTDHQVGINYPRGVTNYDANAINGWFIGNDGQQGNRLVLRKVSFDANNVPTLSSDIFITVDAFHAPSPFVPQPTPQSTPPPPTMIRPIGDALFKQLTSSTLRNGEIWTSHTVAVNSAGQADPACDSTFTLPTCRDALHWYRINVAGPTPQVISSSTIYDPNNYYIYGSVMVSGQGNALFGMTISGPSTFPSAGAAYLLAGTVMSAGLVATQAGAAPYYPSDSTYPLKWGDYSFTSLDPCDDMTMWTLQEYAFSSTDWGLWAAKVRAPAPIITNITNALSGVHRSNVTISGIGFYNPNIMTYCHIPIVVSTGPSVVTRIISYSPTQLIVELNTCSSYGMETMTVTNPDQQVVNRDYAVNTNTVACPHDYPGVYRPSQGIFYMKTSYTGTPADLTVTFGAPNWKPITGDWDGNGIDTVGVVNPTNGAFYLTNTSNGLAHTDYNFIFGLPGDMPLAGKWTPTATHDGVSVYHPSNGVIYLKNNLTTGNADYSMVLGSPGDIGIAGDWNSDNVDSRGVFHQPSSGSPIFYLSNQVTNGVIYSDVNVTYGLPNDLPIVGDWTGIGYSGIGVYHPSNGIFSLKNLLTAGNPDNVFLFGLPGDLPIAGHWLGGLQPPATFVQSGVIVPNTPTPKPIITQPPITPSVSPPSIYD